MTSDKVFFARGTRVILTHSLTHSLTHDVHERAPGNVNKIIMKYAETKWNFPDFVEWIDKHQNPIW